MSDHSWSIKVSQVTDRVLANRKSKTIAQQIGFTKVEEIEKILITVNELSSNLIKHTSGGEIIISILYQNGKKGIQIESIDDGPGIEDIELALVDGYSTINSLGYGLGTVNRLMDDFKIESRKNTGTHITAKRWLVDRTKQKIYSLDFGHGPLANQASKVAIQYIQKNFDQPLGQIIRGMHLACKHSRGVVAALARFNLLNREIIFTGVGNIEARTFGNNMRESFISRRGIIGHTLPTIKLIRHIWETGFILIMFSDGIRSGWKWINFAKFSNKPARYMALLMLERLAKDIDDATIVIVKEFAI